MTELRYGTKLYRITKDYELEELTYVSRISVYRFVESNLSGKTIKIAKGAFDNLCLSRMIILSELEDMLRYKIEKVHTYMRTLKMSFNPLDTPNIIYVISNGGRSLREVHQYSEAGGYIKSHASCTVAAKELSGTGKNSGRVIKAAQRGGKSITLGYRWSYTKLKKLNL